MFVIEEAKKESENSSDMNFTYAVNKLQVKSEALNTPKDLE